MIYAMSLLTIVAVAFFSIRGSQPRETRLVLSRTIHRPASSIFEIVGAVDRVPIWRQSPQWLPGFLRISGMSGWGEHTPTSRRPGGVDLTGFEEIRIRHLKNREFGYFSIRPSLRYESTFRIVPGDGKCHLTWEIRFSVHRLPDLLRQSEIAAAARTNMNDSLDYIQRIALTSASSMRHRNRIFVARRDQVPAA